MPHWKTILTYDGTPYNGWQIQPSLPTVQGALAQAIHRVTGETVLPQGSGRTDTGVHALAQVATFSLSVPIPAANLHRALNRALPPSIRVLSVTPVPEDFHARHSARRKTYEYRILPGCDDKDRICSPMLAPYVWACRLPLELAPLQQAAAHILGPHDFTSFAAVDPDLTTRTTAPDSTESPSTLSPDLSNRSDISTSENIVTPTNQNSVTSQKSTISTEAAHGLIVSSAVERPPHSAGIATDPAPDQDAATPKKIIPTDNTRTIFHSAWHQHEDLLIYRITGSGFLHHMVRNLVGTFVEIAVNRLHPDDIPKILAARNRSAAGPTAPARGLFLVEVSYAEDEITHAEAEVKH
ncbi:tRNA pseudouridine synthase A [Tunturiibacter gelidoferens]|uniref:tRNA pseudouridine(38-40) synthase n=1 Tax=Tunturiibacter gelidiferens TaxID=3069689 RepID=A0ACC5NVF4_9BACT|nr:tRNA pseudouridine synthase A [Edaphobacter lichenicola]MBB5338562.1 tRNA pseudouridine(38-40) synthase [Edaphobacter lichenicola]